MASHCDKDWRLRRGCDFGDALRGLVLRHWRGVLPAHGGLILVAGSADAVVSLCGVVSIYSINERNRMPLIFQDNFQWHGK